MNTTRQTVRRLQTSVRRCDRVAPPHPISHMRPIIYDDSIAASTPTSLRHPYSLSEFNATSLDNLGDYEFQYKLQRQYLDAFHHNFWLDVCISRLTFLLKSSHAGWQSNSRFNAGKTAILESLPPSATPRDGEIALSEFYKQWLIQEAQRTDRYTKEWRSRNISLIVLAVRLKYQKMWSRLCSIGKK